MPYQNNKKNNFLFNNKKNKQNSKSTHRNSMNSRKNKLKKTTFLNVRSHRTATKIPLFFKSMMIFAQLRHPVAGPAVLHLPATAPAFGPREISGPSMLRVPRDGRRDTLSPIPAFPFNFIFVFLKTTNIQLKITTYFNCFIYCAAMPTHDSSVARAFPAAPASTATAGLCFLPSFFFTIQNKK